MLIICEKLLKKIRWVLIQRMNIVRHSSKKFPAQKISLFTSQRMLKNKAFVRLFRCSQRNTRLLFFSFLSKIRVTRRSVISCKYLLIRSEPSSIEPKNIFSHWVRSHNFLIFLRMPKKNTKDKIQKTKYSETSSLRDAILRDIHTKNIRPRARWQYILLHMGLYTSWIVTIILGSFACALMILEFSLPERAYLHWMQTQDNDWLLALPYLWWIGLIFAVTIGYFIFSKTGRSYRFHAGIITTILVLGSFVGGEILYITRIAHWSDRQMQRFEPRYRDFRRTHMLPRPEDGVLPLRILSIQDNILRGKSPDGHDWEVTLMCASDACRQRKEKLILGRPVLFEGTMSGRGTFFATEFLSPPQGFPKNIHKKNTPIFPLHERDNDS